MPTTPNFETPVDLRRKLPHALTILPTYKCTAACEHCCFQSNPTISHRVPQSHLLQYIDQAAELGSIRLVCFSGGEPFVLGDDLVELVARSARHGFLTRIVTNGFWAADDQRAHSRLEPLIEAGLNEINFSTGDDHRKFVSVARVARGMAVALDLGLRLAVMIEDRAGRGVCRETVLNETRKYPQLHQAMIDGQVTIIESPWIEFVSDGTPVTQHPDRYVNARNLHLREPCTSVLGTVVVTPGEHLGMCCGLPREQIPDLDAGCLRTASMKQLVERCSADFLKIWLLVEGPERILAWAASKDSSIQWEDRYAHNCDACRALFQDSRVWRVIEAYSEEKYSEVLARYALYLQSANPASAASAASGV